MDTGSAAVFVHKYLILSGLSGPDFFWIRMMNRISLALVFCTLFLATLNGQESGDAIRKYAGTTMGTVQWNVSIVPGSQSGTSDVPAGVQQVLDELNSTMSTWIPESEVSRFNDSASTEWFPVSRQTAIVVQRSLEISLATGGAFDITVKPLVELWNFGAGPGEFSLPEDVVIQKLLGQTGFQYLECRLDPPAIRKTRPEIQIDLSGVAKGYAVDLVREWIVAQGFDSWFVEVGGEVSVGGRKPDGSDWRVGIEKPLDDARTIEHVVALDGQCLATSGDYRNFAIVNGRRYSHTISPATGQPVEHALASVSVIANDCMTADALATAITVAGPDRVVAIAGLFAVEVLAMERMDNGRFREIRTDGFSRFLQESESTSTADSSSAAGVMLATVLIVGLAILGLAIGAIIANKPIKGSCGGLGNIAGASDCQMCKGTAEACPKTGKP